MRKIYKAFVPWGNELIPVTILRTYQSEVTHLSFTVVRALGCKPFNAGTAKVPVSDDTKTFLSAHVLIKCFLILSKEEWRTPANVEES